MLLLKTQFVWFYLCYLCFVSASRIQSLEGTWKLQDIQGNYPNLTANVPGGVYTDLINNNIIGDVFYEYNDTETRWVSKTNWSYSYQFQIDQGFYDSNYIDLVFEGLDTFATISINNEEIGKTENMFRRYIFDVKNSLLKVGENIIVVNFTSPVFMAAKLSSNQDYVIPPDCPTAQQNGECHVNQIRKMQASFSWDWGPALPSMGIWKTVYLEAYNMSTIRDLIIKQKEVDGAYLITMDVYLACKNGGTVDGALIYNLQTDVSFITGIVKFTQSNSNSGVVKVTESFSVPRVSRALVKKWWPNGYGEPKLYPFTIKFQVDNETSIKTANIGFRTIQLIQDKNFNKTGLNFYFEVNSIPIFAKGANQIPFNILPEQSKDSIVLKHLQSVHDTNMNMLRVWGGGVYESDFFYDQADKLGILIWQDFMFACALYPSYPEFLSNVKSEVEHQVKRLSNHPSIALWAGNNENEVALMTNWFPISENLTLYKNDYIKLYIDTIQDTIKELNEELIFIPSSPSNGQESQEENYLSKNPQDPLYGDVHFYNYLINSLEPKTYPIPRFASEYGYQSLPSLNTWMTATKSVENLQPSSKFMNHRQHHPLGLLENSLLINYQLTLNESSPNYYKAYIFYSQILQAISIKFETEYYRSFMGRIDELGRGNTMGALFWQLNDVWVAPTWSSIDFAGNWKMLHYYAKDFFAPTIVTGYLDAARQLKIYVVSEVLSLINSSLEASLFINVYNWNSFEMLNSTMITFSLDFGKSIEVFSINTDSFLSNAGCGTSVESRKNCFFYLSLSSENELIAPANLIVPEAIKNTNVLLSSVEIVSIKQIDDMGLKFIIVTETNAISLFVWLDCSPIKGRFSENGYIQVTPNKSVTFVAEKPTSSIELKKVLTVTHLKDNIYI